MIWSHLWVLGVLLIAGGLVYKLVGEVIEHDITWVEFIAYMMGLMAAVAVMVPHLDDPLGHLLGLSIAAFALLQGAINNLVNQSLIAAMRVADVQQSERLLKTRQDIPYAFRTIGEVLFERGLYGEALPYLKRAVSGDRDPDVEWKLRYCEDEIRRREQDLQVCPRCLRECPTTAKHCPWCNHYLGIRVKRLVGAGSPLLGALLALCGLAALAWMIALLLQPNPWLCLLAAVPLIAVLLTKREAFTALLQRLRKV
jgi:ribosomal protein L40E